MNPLTTILIPIIALLAAILVVQYKLKIDIKYKLKYLLLGNLFPTTIVVLEQFKNGYRIRFDKQRRKKIDRLVEMKTLREGKITQPVDYNDMLLTKTGKSAMLYLDNSPETDGGDMHPLLPIKCGEIFTYDQNGKITKGPDGNPQIRKDFLEKIENKQQDSVIGLEVLEKNRLEWLVQRAEKSAMKHVIKDNSKSLLLGGAIILPVIVMLAMILAPKAATEVTTTMPTIAAP